MKKFRILIVDDHKLVRNGIKYTIENGRFQGRIDKIDEAINGDDAITLCKVNNYDIIFMDINMPDRDGISVTQEILKLDKFTKIVAISMYNEEYEIRSMINAGAVGYLLKNAGTEILDEAIDTIINGGHYYSNEVAIKLMNPYNESKFQKEKQLRSSVSQDHDILTKREKEVLALIASEMTNEEIAGELNVSKRTIDSHRQNIISKLQVKNTAGLIKYAFKIGLI
ncbi:response regulator transcription factor [Paracrocinitomix mangrovi]|uniref:response regulator n=1 Tax=Paracrocinitomix mangrovi TaxID=2862509 RepID=UPI001C8E9481|nr:response regulator transcription factor [Paracrocinitomix mangrovi]UKN01151.1 response regulator transcription factor [Paracrocinitomix mangrovi]